MIAAWKSYIITKITSQDFFLQILFFIVILEITNLTGVPK